MASSGASEKKATVYSSFEEETCQTHLASLILGDRKVAGAATLSSTQDLAKFQATGY